MSKRCDVCGKGSQKSASRSHSNIKTLRRQYVNLQTKTVEGERLKLCTTCVKTLKRKTPNLESLRSRYSK